MVKAWENVLAVALGCQRESCASPDSAKFPERFQMLVP